MKKLFSSKNMMVIVGFLGLYLISTGVSWAVFSYLGGSSVGSGLTGAGLTGLAKERARIAELPKDRECPINGGMFTKVEEEIWEKRRPLTAVIENSLDARPQSGLSKADVVYEAVAEGGVTRFLGVFHCAAAGEDLRLAPIRSARIYFVNWAAEYGIDPIFLHIGGANNICGHCPGGVKSKLDVAPEVNAFAALVDLGWRNGVYGNDFDGGTNVGFPVTKRDQYRLETDEPAAWEHSVVAFVDKAHDEAVDRGFGAKGEDGDSWDETFESWVFADEAPVANSDYSEIEFEFWSNKGDYDVMWKYDAATNTYKRVNGGVPFVDWEFDNAQIAAKNVVVQFVSERGPVDREKHMYYEVIDDGEALVFQNGTVVEGTWEKDSRLGRTMFYGEDGELLEFVRGQIWIEAVPVGNDIVY